MKVLKAYIKRYMHPTVVEYYQETDSDGISILHVRDTDRWFTYDMKRVESIEVREHKRVGIQFT